MKILRSALGVEELKARIEALENKVEAQNYVITTIVEAVRNHSRAIVIITDDFKHLLESLKLQTRVSKRKNTDDIYH
jgi:uncharacterized coiled-coil protein SlyX